MPEEASQRRRELYQVRREVARHRLRSAAAAVIASNRFKKKMLAVRHGDVGGDDGDATPAGAEAPESDRPTGGVPPTVGALATLGDDAGGGGGGILTFALSSAAGGESAADDVGSVCSYRTADYDPKEI